MVRKKKRASNPRKNIALNTEKNAVFTAERYSVFAKEAIQFTVKGRNILMERKRKKNGESVNPLNSMMKDINPFRQNNNNNNVLLRMILGFSSSDTMMEGPTLQEKKIFAGKSAR
ncbi:hypothetical protein TNCV_4986521 [Trichonephila clavipes]|nr:hypothetical protein TNCV_4986521 [Trichonephila clavipes]